MLYKDNACYFGEFDLEHNDDQLNGIMIYSNQDIYNGKWLKNIRKNGSMTYSDGHFYNGLWLNDHAIVNGQFKYSNGDIYTGQHANGYKEGIGKMVYCNKETCEGEWSDDLFIIGN